MSIEVGSVVTGKVTGITKFGAFVDLESGKNGLVHISEIAPGFVKDVNDYLSLGDQVKVKVVNLGEDGKIALSIRQANSADQVNQASEKKEKKAYHRPKRPASDFKRSTKPKGTQTFDDMMSAFLKDSDDRLTSLKRNTEGKRGGRGGRRN
ncbi:RNA-binding protein S1 [Aerococcus urinaehominis]|uniref:RNA-binding protein S1 n=1 Tax=Aerococcus urinaehominis TaxID=128944 RepID=A0A0X8FKU0_9LACT|nr:S1 domain-containing RNA-binding protein [Aerococcus urinaehominis]AMB99166.1 RNA-binding protein S1 [Aerococcus urinaehominis]SDM05991.1 S1 RNA binding domain protein [Aerococcus urinaehominis]